jgi:hypothetical protein
MFRCGRLTNETSWEVFLFVIVISVYRYVMHCRFENKRIYKGMQLYRLKKIAVSDSS